MTEGLILFALHFAKFSVLIVAQFILFIGNIGFYDRKNGPDKGNII